MLREIARKFEAQKKKFLIPTKRKIEKEKRKTKEKTKEKDKERTW